MDEPTHYPEDDFEVPEGWERAPDKSNRRPLKHMLPELLKAKNALVREWAEGHVRSFEREEQRRRVNEAAFKRERRAEAKAAPARAIEREAVARLKTLRRAIKYRHSDKLLEQLPGREVELTNFWKSGRLAELQLGRVPTDAEIGAIFAKLQGLPKALTKDQARSKRQLVKKLERYDLIWRPFCNKVLVASAA